MKWIKKHLGVIARRLVIVGGATAGVMALATPGVMWAEGRVLGTYLDPVGIPTACYGETGAHIQMGQEYTLDECLKMLDESLWTHWRGVERCLYGEVTINQAAAILSWTYNVGVHAACTSTLALMVRAGAPADTWCRQLLRWDKATVMGVKVTLPGLSKRRKAETTMCLTGEWPEWVAP